jgi:hypothetical protein
VKKEHREDAELEFKPKIEGNNAEGECQHRHERAEHGEHDGDGGFPRQALDTSMPTGRSSVATINGALSSPRRRCFYLATLNEKTESAGSPCVNILILLVTGYGSPPFPFDRNTLGSNGSFFAVHGGLGTFRRQLDPNPGSVEASRI